MSSPNPKPTSAVPRLSKINTIGSLLAGVAIIIAGGALIDSDPGINPHAMTVIGLSVSSQTVAAAIIVIAMIIIGLNLRSALRLLRPSREAVSTGVSAGPPEYPTGAAAQTDARPAVSSGGLASGHLVALRLLEPAPDLLSAEMDLLEAARYAFRESQTTAAASFATAIANHPDDIIKMYATFVAEHVPIYGRRTPSDAVERISMSNPLKEFRIEDGDLILQERDGSQAYRALTIRTDDFKRVIEQLAAHSFS